MIQNPVVSRCSLFAVRPLNQAGICRIRQGMFVAVPWYHISTSSLPRAPPSIDNGFLPAKTRDARTNASRRRCGIVIREWTLEIVLTSLLDGERSHLRPTSALSTMRHRHVRPDRLVRDTPKILTWKTVVTNPASP